MKLRNIHDFVDVYQSSQQRMEMEHKLDAERKLEEEEANKLKNQEEDDVPDFYKKGKEKKLKEVNENTDDLTKTLIKQKNEKVFNEALDKQKKGNDKFQTYFPDIT